MNTKINLMKVFFVIGLVAFPSLCFASFPLSEVISLTPTDTFPFNATKKTPFLKGYNYPIDNSNNLIPDKLYKNVQCTEYFHASASWDLTGMFYRKFQIPNSNNFLVVVAFGGVTEWSTFVLCIVNPSGTILSTIEGSISDMYLHIKQFRITAQAQIIVTTITTNSATSIPLEAFTSFVGQRVDKTYSINAQGQFVQESIQNYQTQIYTNLELNNRDFNIWEGNETPLPNPVVRST